MSTLSYINERAKYNYILSLSKNQIRALELNDMAGFSKILAAKHTLISSLRDGKKLLELDPTLQTVVNQINDSEKMTEKLLYRRLGHIRRQLSEIQEFNLARRAYKKISRKVPSFVMTSDTPMMLDQRS